MADDVVSPNGTLGTVSAETDHPATTPSAALDANEQTSAETPAEEDTCDNPSVEDNQDSTSATAKPPRRTARTAVVFGAIAIIGLGALGGWLGVRDYQGRQHFLQRSLFLAVGRQAALNLTTIDWQHVEGDVQRVLDASTGSFHDDFQKRSQPFIEVVKRAQSKSEGTITAAGLESVGRDEAQVLVAISVRTSLAGAPEQEPRSWRMRIDVQKVGNDTKVFNVEFVP